MNEVYANESITVKALEDNVQVVGLTRGDGTKPQHTESLSKGEVFVVQFTENISAIKIRGKAVVLTKSGQVTSGDNTNEKNWSFN